MELPLPSGAPLLAYAGRRAEALRALVPAPGHVLEIGPGASPIFARRDGYRVTTLDHTDTATLRRKFANAPGADVDRIEEVDRIWRGEPISELVGEERYDLIVASHVFEHLPDPLGFLVECEKVLAPGGRVLLAIPDRRGTFDFFRPVTTTGAVLQAHLEGRTRHTPGSRFDSEADYVHLSDGAWLDRGETRTFRPRVDLAQAARAYHAEIGAAEYRDCHGTVYTPSSFRLILSDLQEIGATILREESLHETGHIEFVVILSRDGGAPARTREELMVATYREGMAPSTPLPEQGSGSGATPARSPVVSYDQGREAAIRGLVPPPRHVLEVGPSFRPIYPRADGTRVTTIDHDDAAALREKYRNDPAVDVARIEEVDHVWRGEPISELVGDERYDLVVASHVFEHLTDPLGFLRECDRVLAPGGRILLVLPDRRRTFDFFRPMTTTGGLLQAALEGRARHTPGNRFDFLAGFAQLGGDGTFRRTASVRDAHGGFRQEATGSPYVDCHAWIFTPASFRLVISDLAAIGATTFREEQIHGTPAVEFVAILSRAGAGPLPSRSELLVAAHREAGEIPPPRPASPA